MIDYNDLKQDIEELKEKYNQQKVEMALFKQSLEHMSKSLDGINSTLNRIFWAVGGGIIIAITKFLIDGGFNGGAGL